LPSTDTVQLRTQYDRNKKAAEAALTSVTKITNKSAYKHKTNNEE